MIIGYARVSTDGQTLDAQLAVERRDDIGGLVRRPAAEEPNDGHRLLRARRERPCRRAADERDEVATPHGDLCARRKLMDHSRSGIGSVPCMLRLLNFQPEPLD